MAKHELDMRTTGSKRHVGLHPQLRSVEIQLEGGIVYQVDSEDYYFGSFGVVINMGEKTKAMYPWTRVVSVTTMNRSVALGG